MVRLSICIPTYNFGDFIGETLDSILPQLTSEVELIVLDGGSLDATTDVVHARQRECPQLIYCRQDARGGIDRDIEKVVSLARGDYCWLFSADDIMLPGAVGQILESIKTNDDVYLCEHTLCDFEMNPIGPYPPFRRQFVPKIFDLSDERQKIDYFYSANTSEAFFSFMAGPIFKKQIWDAAVVPESFRDTCWIVAGHLLSMVPRGFKVNYMRRGLLLKRGGNDSFADRGLVNRCRIAIEGFQHVGDAVFGRESFAGFHIRRVLRADIGFKTLLLAKMLTAETPLIEDITVLNRIVKLHYSDPSLANWIRYGLYKLAHPFILKILYQLKKMWRAERRGN